MGHEYCGGVEEVGSAVTNIQPGQFVVGSRAMDERRAVRALLLP
jgi:threonine dehydrogenase-like Zn-dependent dehydrogenase